MGACLVCATSCSDLYEGTRAAQVTDMRGIQALLQPLEEAGVLVARSEERVSLTHDLRGDPYVCFAGILTLLTSLHA